MGWETKYGHNIFLRYESLLDIVSTNTSLQCTILKVLMTFQMKVTTFFPHYRCYCVVKETKLGFRKIRAVPRG